MGGFRVPLQEEIIGRRKIDNIEIDDDDAPRGSAECLASSVDASGNEYDVLRDNMPFRRPGQGEFGTYFIGCSRYLGSSRRCYNEFMLAIRLALTTDARFLDPTHSHDVLRAISPDAETLAQAAQAKLTAPTP